ncbi:MAG: ribokinase [Spirochaetales bacterium]|nr:ribokinase [Spirochaetales bacterium]
MDLVFHTERFPVPGETLTGTGWVQRPGGKGRNQAVSAARFWPRVSMIGAVGDDAFAGDLLESLRTVGVDTTMVATVSNDVSGVSVAILEPAGDSECVVVSGVNMRIPPEAIAVFSRLVRRGDIVVLQNEIGADTNETVARFARQMGATVVLNAAPYRAVSADFASTVDVLVVNEVEAAGYAGIESVTPHNAVQALDRLTEDWGSQAVVITLGKDGVAYRRHDTPVRTVAAHRVASNDAHGAGDAFVGALAGRLLDRDDLDDAVQYANAAAAATIAAPFAERGTIGEAEVAAFLR